MPYKSYGSKTLGGMSMLVWQAVRSHEIWDNVSYKEDDIAQLVVLKNLRNCHSLFFLYISIKVYK